MLALLGVAAVGVSGCSGTSQSQQATSATTAASRQTVLRLHPNRTAAVPSRHSHDGPAGAVWVQDGGHDKLVKLAVGPDAQTELPLPILGMHGDVHAVDSAGNVYGANGGGVDPNGGCCLAVHVVTQAVGSDTPTVLPFDGIDKPIRVTVDTAGNVYVVDGGHRRVLKLAPSASN
jgi:hypothetical protein